MLPGRGLVLGHLGHRRPGAARRAAGAAGDVALAGAADAAGEPGAGGAVGVSLKCATWCDAKIVDLGILKVADPKLFSFTLCVCVIHLTFAQLTLFV